MSPRTLKLLPFLLAALALAACGHDLATIEESGPEEFEEELDSLTTITDDDLNGLYTASVVDGGVLPGEATVESWPAVGIRLTLSGTQQNSSKN